MIKKKKRLTIPFLQIAPRTSECWHFFFFFIKTALFYEKITDPFSVENERYNFFFFLFTKYWHVSLDAANFQIVFATAAYNRVNKKDFRDLV